MMCRECGAKTQVTDTKEYYPVVYRWRRCPECGAKFKTAEQKIVHEPKRRTKV